MAKTPSICLLLVFCFLPSFCLCVDQSFVPIPEEDKHLYRIDLKKWYYPDEEARQRDLAELLRMKEQMASWKSDVGTKPEILLAAIELKARMGVLVDRLQAFGNLRFMINIEDELARKELQEGNDAFNGVNEATTFVDASVQALDEATLRNFFIAVPSLSIYEFQLKTWRRNKSHMPTEPVELALNSLASRLNPFDEEFYSIVINQSPDAILQVGDQLLKVTNAGQYNEILHLENRNLREAGFLKRMATYKAQKNLFAFALNEKMQSANSVANLRNFSSAMDASLFNIYLTPEVVDMVLKEFRDHSSLTLRFRKAECAYQQKVLGIKTIEPWDLEARPENAPEPRFAIVDAVRTVQEATKMFGPEYATELANVLEPRNGRLDIVAGPKRGAGDFTSAVYGQAYVLYMQGYNGYLTDVITLAHESAHVTHYRLLYQAGVPWYYGDGSRYITEGLAKVNELLVLDYLIKTAKTSSERLFYLRALNSKLASIKFAAMYWAAYATAFEMEVCRRIKAGNIKTPEEIHEVWAELGRLWIDDYDRFTDLKYTWADTHHFFDAPRAYSNYLFAWIFALAVYDRLQSDPAMAEKFVDLMKAGFSDEPSILLQKHLGVNLSDPDTVKRIFSVVEQRLAEFELQVLTDNK